MKTTIERIIEQEVEIKSISIEVEVRHGDEVMPYDYPGRVGEIWKIEVDMDSGQILNWKDTPARDIYMKVVDCGTYKLLAPDGTVIAVRKNDYVPDSAIPGDYGEYLDFKISETGVITNWYRQPDVHEFFNVED